MPKHRQRVCLNDGQRLDINRLIRDGTIPPAMKNEKAGPLRVRYPEFEQEIRFASRPRHFGGRQWYFQCPATGRLCSVLWKPPGASRFACRQAWGRQVAYRTQFVVPTDRAHMAKAKIRAKMHAPEGWEDVPPRPRWMREATYARWEARYDEQERKLDEALLALWRTR